MSRVNIRCHFRATDAADAMLNGWHDLLDELSIILRHPRSQLPQRPAWILYYKS